MTRFDAADPTERRKLVADAIVAHRERGSAFLTVELDPESVGSGVDADGERDALGGVGDATGAGGNDANGSEIGGGDANQDGDVTGTTAVPWIQFADRTFNLDCTDAELARLEDLLAEFPEFRIDAMESPEGAEGTNVRISARSDANRLAAFVDRAFRAVYGAPEDYRAWVVRI